MPLIYPIGFMNVAAAASYTTWNSSDKSANISLTGPNNLIASCTVTTQSAVRSVSSKATGKWYFEITWTTRASDMDDVSFGVGNSTASLSAFVGDANGWGIHHDHAGGNYNIRHSGSDSALTPTGTPVSGTVYNFALDVDAGKLWAGINGTWFNSGDPGGTGAGTVATSVTGTLFIMGSSTRNGDVFTLNAGATTFNTAAPSGFSGWTA